MDVVILAGGKSDDDLRAASGAEFRADVPYLGRPMVEIVASSMAYLGQPLIVGARQGTYPRQIEGGQNFIESIVTALAEIVDSTFLLATVDLPFLTQGAVEGFLERCDPAADLNYPIIPLEICTREHPLLKRTSLKLKEGVFTGGNLSLVKTEAMRRGLPILKEAYARRKKPLHLANMVGLTTLGRVAVGQFLPSTLPIQTLEQQVGAFLQMSVRGIITPFASIGTDIDSADQYLSIISSPAANISADSR